MSTKDEGMTVSPNGQQTDVSSSAFILPAADWKTFEQENPPYETPVWLKLSNGNIVLSIYRSNGMGSTGWWQVTYKDGSLMASCNAGFLARGAVWQECIQFGHCY